MRKLKLIALVAAKDPDFRKACIGSVIVGIGCVVIFSGGIGGGKKLGAEKVIRVAEDMQPGFREALKAFVKEDY